MKRSIGTVVMALTFWFATYAVVQLAVRREMNGEHRRRVDAVVAEMEVQVERAREINRIRAAAVFWVADGDTMYLREGEIMPADPIAGRAPGRPVMVSK